MMETGAEEPEVAPVAVEDAAGVPAPDPFDSPFEPEVDETTTVDGSYDLNDESRTAAMQLQASMPSEMIDPSQVYGEDEWAQMSVVSPEDAVTRFRIDWDWNMTPGQRMRALASAAMQKRWNALNDEMSDLVVSRQPRDPAEAADDIILARMARDGR